MKKRTSLNSKVKVVTIEEPDMPEIKTYFRASKNSLDGGASSVLLPIRVSRSQSPGTSLNYTSQNLS